jgi:hypothetical protein
MRQPVAATALTLGLLLLTACGGTSPATPKSAAAHSDPRTTKALLRIARRFNDDYSGNRVGAVYDRWDARSRAVISRADYIRRHQECHSNPGPATIQGATREGGWWLVRYSISDTSLTDYWRYQHGRWVFDLVRSNPDAVRLYRLKPTKYLAALGCHP